MDLLAHFSERVRREGLCVHGVAVQQDGRLLAARQWSPDEPRVLHSLSKSFTALAVGMLVDEGRLRLEERVVDFFPGQRPAVPSDRLLALRVEHLLTMSAGHDRPLMMSEQRAAIREPDWVRYYLAQPLDRLPGERFVYDSGCTYLLSALIQERTGKTLLDFLTPRLFQPLGIPRPRWETCPLGRTLGCAGLYLRTAQLLPFGQLCLNRGAWRGVQLVSRAWLDRATGKRIDTSSWPNPDNAAGYGYQFWMNRVGGYRADGAYSQFCIVLPERRAVIAVTATEARAQALLDGIWQDILPGLS